MADSNTDFNELLINELNNIKTDMRHGFSELRKTIKDNDTNYYNNYKDCSNKFLEKNTFYKVLSIIIILILGSYSYTSIVINIFSACGGT
jgi:hypothetical protein